MVIECIATTIEDARRIEAAGGDRIELVSALTEGGLTPSFALVEGVTKAVKIPVNVMIRPHSKSFVYTDEEIQMMKKEIQYFRRFKINGVVLGVLNHNNQIHVSHLEDLLTFCDDLDVTFHRAIDEINVINGVELLSKYSQITSILTSGGLGKVVEQLEVIEAAMKRRKHLNILLGGGLNFKNIELIKQSTTVTDFHFGTAIREEQALLGEIEKEKIRQLKKLLI